MSDDKEYWVRLPVAGILAVHVEAEDEEAAIEKALEVEWCVNITSEDDVELDDLDTYEKIVEGNINYAPLWSAEADEI